MTTLVTGAAGFIGMHLALRLARDGADVVGVDNFDPYYDVALKRARADQLARAGVRCVELDLADHAATAALFRDGAIRARRASGRAAGRAVFAAESGGLHPQQHRCVRRGHRGLPPHRRRAPGVCIELERVRRQPHAAVLRGSERRSSGEPVRGDQEGRRADRAQLQPFVPAADDRLALLHRLRPVGPARHGGRAVHARDRRRHADQGVQLRPDASRLHLHRRRRRRRRAGALARRPKRPTPAPRPTRSTTSATIRRSIWNRSSASSSDCSASARSANTCRRSRATCRRRSPRSTASRRRRDSRRRRRSRKDCGASWRGISTTIAPTDRLARHDRIRAPGKHLARLRRMEFA